MSYFAEGQWNADCDQCGRMFKSGSLRKQWNGLYTCSQCWEPRQPQDFVRAVKDNSPPAYVRGGAINFWGANAGGADGIGMSALGQNVSSL